MDKLLGSIMEKIGPYRPKRVYLQAPEGLKTRIQDMALALEGRGIEVLVGCEPTYGACDLRDKEAKALGADLLLHVGHTDFGVKACLPVVYEPYEIAIDPIPFLEKNLSGLEGYNKISLLTTVQFAKSLGPAKAFLESRGKHVLMARQARNQQEGLLLGCDWTAALPLQDKVDCFLYMGSGKFHPLGLARKTQKPVLWLDFETSQLKDMNKEKLRLEKIKAFHIEQARENQNFGILVSVKEGQFYLKKALELKRELEGREKRVWILVMDELSPSKIEGMKLDILVNCACPRVDEDFSPFKKPILNPEDVYRL